MNRNFPPETIEPCDMCGRDLTLLVTDEGLEANDQRDYVYAPANGDINDRVICCADCLTATGIGEPDKDRDR